MKRANAVIAVPLVALAAAGCGSGGHKTTAAGSSVASGAPAASTASGSAGAYGPYGAGSSSSSGSSSASSGSSGSGSGSSGTSVAKVTTKHSKLGTILAAGPKQLTVYMFEGDATGKSNCTGACTSVWPPVTASSGSAAGLAMQADISTIIRSDGSQQLAYKGHPLYYFVRDKDSGDAYGQGVNGFGHSWYVLAPSGKKVDNS